MQTKIHIFIKIYFTGIHQKALVLIIVPRDWTMFFDINVSAFYKGVKKLF